jgi:hypothetical protein
MIGHDPEDFALKLAAMKAALPPGGEMVVFLIMDVGANFESGLLATLPPAVFAPVIRGWLERYDAGEATGWRADA